MQGYYEHTTTGITIHVKDNAIIEVDANHFEQTPDNSCTTFTSLKIGVDGIRVSYIVDDPMMLVEILQKSIAAIQQTMTEMSGPQDQEEKTTCAD